MVVCENCTEVSKVPEHVLTQTLSGNCCDGGLILCRVCADMLSVGDLDGFTARHDGMKESRTGATGFLRIR